ncbi:hypothetical protein O9992_23595 [Vibrio lentus]|nr:hypothetical protein [Vibrio lentus]
MPPIGALLQQKLSQHSVLAMSPDGSRSRSVKSQAEIDKVRFASAAGGGLLSIFVIISRDRDDRTTGRVAMHLRCAAFGC